MATEITLPRLGQGMESGTIVRWLKAEGDAVERDEPIYEVDTEKVTQEVESPVAGVLLKILVAEGSEVPVGRLLCFIGEAGEAVPDRSRSIGRPGQGEHSANARVAQADAGLAESAEAPAPVVRRARARAREAEAAGRPAGRSDVRGAGDDRVKASPLARRMARERGIDLAIGQRNRARRAHRRRGSRATRRRRRGEGIGSNARPCPAAYSRAFSRSSAPTRPEFETVRLTGMRAHDRAAARRGVGGAALLDLPERRHASADRASGGPRRAHARGWGEADLLGRHHEALLPWRSSSTRA